MSESVPKFAGPIRIFSDLHLGHPGSRVSDVAQLRPLLEGARTVLFNGDTFELRKTSLVDAALAHRAALESLCSELGARPVFMTGNHDPQITEHHHFDLCGGAVFLTHGDVLYEDVSPWSKLIAEMHKILDQIREEYPADYRDDLELSLKAVKRISAETVVRKVCKPGRLAKIKTLLMESWPPKRPILILKSWARSHHLAHALRDKFRPQAKFIVFGHTHRAVVHQAGGKVAINTGAFQPMSKSLVVRIDDGRLRVDEVVERGGEFRFGRNRGEWDLG
jgi:UDP-2,3-diacylglucosamine pyrophosphatase LpxH